MDDKEGQQYLPEDKDLLDDLNAIGLPRAGRMEHILAAIQVKATLRSRKTMRDLDESTRKYSLVLVAFALAQLALGIFEFLFNAEFSGHEVVGIVYVIAITILIAYILSSVFKEVNKK